MRRAAFALATAALVAAALGGCSTAGDGGGVGSECASGPHGAGAPGDADALLTFGIAVDGLTSGGDSEGVVIVYADGAVATTLDQADLAPAADSMAVAPMVAVGYYGEQPGSYRVGYLSDCALEQVVAAADELFASDLAFGYPVVDGSGVTISYLADVGQEPMTAGIQMFDPDDPDEWSGSVSRHEQANRDAAADLWHMISGAVVLTGDLAVERVQVETYYLPVADDALDWGLAPLSEVLGDRGCAEIGGADVAEVIAALDDGGGVLLPDDPAALSARTLPPGIPACTYTVGG